MFLPGCAGPLARGAPGPGGACSGEMCHITSSRDLVRGGPPSRSPDLLAQSDASPLTRPLPPSLTPIAASLDLAPSPAEVLHFVADCTYLIANTVQPSLSMLSHLFTIIIASRLAPAPSCTPAGHHGRMEGDHSSTREFFNLPLMTHPGRHTTFSSTFTLCSFSVWRAELTPPRAGPASPARRALALIYYN